MIVPGIVVDETERPISGARIHLRDRTEGPNTIGPVFTTAADGRFAFSVVDGVKYDVHVTRYLGDELRPREVQTSVVPFTASTRTPLVTAVMRPNRTNRN